MACTEESHWPLSIKTTANLNLRGSHLMLRLPNLCLGKAHEASLGHGSTWEVPVHPDPGEKPKLSSRNSVAHQTHQKQQNSCYTPCSTLITKRNYFKVIWNEFRKRTTQIHTTNPRWAVVSLLNPKMEDLTNCTQKYLHKALKYNKASQQVSQRAIRSLTDCSSQNSNSGFYLPVLPHTGKEDNKSTPENLHHNCTQGGQKASPWLTWNGSNLTLEQMIPWKILSLAKAGAIVGKFSIS